MLRIILVSLLLTGCASLSQKGGELPPHAKPELNSSQKDKWGYLTGKWYGEQAVKGGMKKQWIVDRNSNGTYLITFRITQEDGSQSETSEVGQWGVSGPVYFSIFRGHVSGNSIVQANPANPYNYDAYEIIELNNQIFTYRYYDTETQYTVRKVENTFTFPK